mmetsp:Transcript_28728/g.39503  ORF Transcript_28728/g.39503 Transcript_28728/m.39503 type:complete len:189 (+) Transcript_28728:323-889(+)
MRQVCLHVQSIMLSIVDETVVFGGIDASINPGLTPPDSVGAGLENLLFPLTERQVGDMGTLAAVSAVTAAIKRLPSAGVQLTGYSGLMLPVMEDLVLAERAAQQPPRMTLRDLLTFSAVCGVGLDTVPIPGDVSADSLAGVYMETAALAFRLDKPLSCRLLPMKGKKAGDWTEVDSPYLVNTRVFTVV